jgi:hypothetical protein
MDEQNKQFKIYRLHQNDIYELNGIEYCKCEKFTENVQEYQKCLNEGWEIDKKEYIFNENYIDILVNIKKNN